MRILILASLLFLTATTHAAPTSGAWFDRTRDGHGMDWQIVGDRLVGGLFSFDSAGEPIWYLIDASIVANTAVGELIEYRASANALPSIHQRYSGFEIRQITNVSDCGDGSARPGATQLFDVRFVIDGQSNRWCLEPLLPAVAIAESALSGSWYAGEVDRGWGLITYRFPVNGTAVAFSTLYVYDAAGKPRWAFAGHAPEVSELGPMLRFARGYCRQCPSQPLVLSPAGDASITLITPRNDVTFNRAALAMSYPFGVGGQFIRGDRPLQVLLSTPPPAAVVATREGIVEGRVEGAQTRYLAIPYVAPPLGNLRWRAPQPALPRASVLRAFSRGPSCAQNAVGEGIAQSDLGPRSEDCLQLNVSAPVQVPAGGLPVMVWIHGGGLTQGSAAETRLSDGRLVYDNAVLADDGVVAVSINYRLGPLGFLAMREFAGEAPDHPTAGNYGLLDQIEALKWVRDNIAAFGGDPRRVTIFGESAGGRSVCALMASPAASGLFHRAIIQSGACPVSLPQLDTASATQAAAYSQGERVVFNAGCASSTDRKACMRSIDWQSLIDVTQPSIGIGREGENFGHVDDDFALPVAPGVALANGTAAQVPLIVGINADEMTTLLGPTLQPQTVAQYEAIVNQQIPQVASQALALYPASNYATPTLALADLYDDIGFACPARAFSLKHANAGQPVYRYVYTHIFAQAAALGAFHGAEIGFVFGPGASFNAAQIELSQKVQRYWTRFATSGDPNGGTDPIWPMRNAARDVAIDLDVVTRAEINDYRKTFCDFWSRFIVF
ncbi:MAG: carboxylesterase/lipase family protein [Pseudomarimonas sp.]